MINQAGMADVYTDFNGLAKLRGQAKDKSPEAIREVARQFESIFIQMTLKSMRSSIQQSGLLDNEQSHLYQEMYDQQIALEMGKRSKLGLADMLVRQLGGDSTPKQNPLGQSLDDYRRTAVPAMAQGGAAEALRAERQAVARIIDRMATAQPNNGYPRQSFATGDGNNGVFDSPEEFVATLWPEAKAAGAQLGVDPKMLLAQAALESNWGKSVPRGVDGLSSHNLFGIKADRTWEGRSFATQTVEYENGVAVKQRAAFRGYDSYADCFRDYVNFLRANPRYAKALENAANPERFIAGLQKAGYATDPGYARKVMSIYNGNNAFGGLTGL